MLTLDKTALVVIDVQGRLAQVMSQKETLFENLQKLIKGVQVLDLPIIWNEQLPEKLGPTSPEIAELLSRSTQPIAKASFSCCGNPPFMDALKATGRKQVLLAGIESHVCVYQTCVDLLNLGYEVQVVSDAVSSRAPENRQLGLARMQQAGATLTSVEMALFELLRVAEGPKFKEITRIVK